MTALSQSCDTDATTVYRGAICEQINEKESDNNYQSTHCDKATLILSENFTHNNNSSELSKPEARAQAEDSTEHDLRSNLSLQNLTYSDS